ncbi:MAG: hypothetical protein M3N53_07635 [Actinomycetota bacterium]|nr:hypothetical protein [Actinomycetota bacterium]
MSVLGSYMGHSVKRIGVGLLASLVLVAPFALGTASAQTSCGLVRGSWTTLDAPSFSDGGSSLIGFTITPARPSQMFATNGTVVMRSTDGGCSWKETYAPGDAGALGGAGENTIEAIVVAEASAARLYLMIREQAGPLVRPKVLRSDDAGTTWTDASAGLPPAGDPAFLRVAPSAPDTLYLAVAVQGVTELLYGSENGGGSWTPRNNFTRRIEGGINDVKVDPMDAQELWVGAVDGLYRSKDGGRTFSPEQEFAGEATGPVDVFHQAGDASIIAFKQGQGSGLISDDGGKNWLKISSPGTPTSIAHGHVKESRLISSVGRVWVYAPNLFSWVDANALTPEITGLIAARTATPAFYGFTPSTIEIYSGPLGADVRTPPDTLVLPDISLLDPLDPPDPRPGELTPSERVIKIDAGDSKTVPYRLTVPRTKTPLDVYFVFDTSSSMARFLAGMSQALEDIITRLGQSGVDVQFGMAEYRAYPDAEPPRVGPRGTDLYEPNFVYRQRQDIASSTTGIEAALDNVEPDGGGYYNAQLGALFHTASAAGADIEPAGPAGPDVPAGTNATFRKEALRVALLVSDEEFMDQPYPGDNTPPDLPKFDEVAAALNAQNIKQVGISLAYKGTAQATGDMQAMARATGARAPKGGVDCDGDGQADVAGGAPLVCTVDNESLDNGASLVPSIVNLVESIRTRASVGLAVARGEEVTQKVTPEVYASMVLQSSNRLTFDVTFRCPLSQAGERFDVKLTTQGIAPALSTTATVVCRSLVESQADDDELPLPFPFERVLGLIPLVPLGPPPPITELASSTQAQAQSQAQAQAQASMAAQEQEQPQLAFVHALHAMRQKAQEEYAMSSLRDRREEPSHGFVLAGATLLMSLAYGATVVMQRSRSRVRRAR